jgi:AcrR family transcriptional regulator
MSEKDQDTEQRIKQAASKIFHQKGFAATTTRDIAQASDTNLALVNYYFRSKKKLYETIMLETLQSFFSDVVLVLNDESTSLKEKVSDAVNAYMDTLTENQNMAPFILNAVRENPVEYLARIGLLDRLKDSSFLKQFQESQIKGEIPPINPLHFMLNLLGLTVFPFIAQPMVSAVSGLTKDLYYDMIQERRRLIPLWIESMLRIS